MSRADVPLFLLFAFNILSVVTTPVEVIENPPLFWKLLSGLFKSAINPIDRSTGDDACSAFCSLGEPAKQGLAAAACGASLLATTWPGFICPVTKKDVD